jgi:hypothetical protein
VPLVSIERVEKIYAIKFRHSFNDYRLKRKKEKGKRKKEKGKRKKDAAAAKYLLSFRLFMLVI